MYCCCRILPVLLTPHSLGLADFFSVLSLYIPLSFVIFVCVSVKISLISLNNTVCLVCTVLHKSQNSFIKKITVIWQFIIYIYIYIWVIIDCDSFIVSKSMFLLLQCLSKGFYLGLNNLFSQKHSRCISVASEFLHKLL